jgi:hypothetical protein
MGEGWRDLLQPEGGDNVILPWTGGRSLCLDGRVWKIDGNLPTYHGWYFFTTIGRKAIYQGEGNPQPDILKNIVTGYLVGNRLVTDNVKVDPDPKTIAANSEPVYLVEDGLDRFVRISAGRVYDDGPLIYKQQEMPLGPEDQVLNIYFDDYFDLYKCAGIKGCSPALDAAFRMEVWQRVEAERRRQEIERIRREEEVRKALEERRAALVANLGNAETRREMAKVDFGEAARAALAVGGAHYLDHRRAPRRGEMVVRFRLDRRRFECVCDEMSLRVVDAGVCLTNERTGEKGDTRFTLESLPSTIMEAIRLGVLVVFRHVD